MIEPLSPEVVGASRWSRIGVRTLDPPAALIFNPRAGQKLGLATNTQGAEQVQRALSEVGIPFEAWPTERPGHATELALRAAQEGRRLVIGAGGDGTMSEMAQALARTDTALGIMPLGSVMNVARMLCVPRDLKAAAQVIAEGRVLAVDLGRVGERYFLEAAGVGLDAGLFGYFEQIDRKGVRPSVLRAVFRFLRRLGSPSMLVEVDGVRHRVRAPMIAVASGPFVGAAYTIAPDARLDDGRLDVVIFQRASVYRVLLHLLLVAGGRRLPPPKEARKLRARSVRVTARGRPLPVHADGQPVGATPAHFSVVPAALKVLAGWPEDGAPRAWE